MAESIILAENEDQTRIYVQLQADHDVDYAGAASLIVTAELSEYGAKIHRISSGSKPKDMRLDAVAMDALAAAWLDLKAKKEAKVQAEKERKQALIKEAYALATRHPEIEIKANNDTKPDCWYVSIPSQRYEFCAASRTPEQLLEQVKACCAVLQGREDTKATA
jgi:hypothetical protein